ncbi:MAG: hypothetical protein ACREOI_07120 [bacterium]
MSTFDEVKFKLWNNVDAVVSLIQRWNPKNCKTEKDHEKSLYEYLHKEFDTIQVTKQYAKGRIKADLVIGGEKGIIIEIKRNLTARAEYQRLIGQLVEYKEWAGSVIVLLAGSIDLNFKKQLEKSSETENKVQFLETKFTIVQK